MSPGRTPGGGRRYSLRDIAQLREVQRLSSQGVTSRASVGCWRLEGEVDRLRRRIDAELESEHRAAALSSSGGPTAALTAPPVR